MKKILVVIGLFCVGFFTYSYVNLPNFDRIEHILSEKTKLKPNQINWKESYKNDVKFDLKNRSISPNQIAVAKIYSTPFCPPKIIEEKDAQILAKILNDSASYTWGETTVEFDRYLIFFDHRNKIVALTKIDQENEFITTVPFTRTMKWGKLSKNGFKEFHSVLNK